MLFKEKLKSNSKIFLDGGNGSEIAKLGGEMSPAFSALASIISPEIVALYCFNGFSAGPLRTIPFKSNLLPWQ